MLCRILAGICQENTEMTGLVPRPHRPRLDPSKRRFGEFIRSERQKKRLGVRDFANKIGMAPGHLSNIENCRVTPPHEEVIHKMAEVLEIPAGALLARAGRLGEADLQRFWQSPMIPALVMASTGWSQEDATTFQEQVLASMS
jgi:transcriptional regulator with XRE-family HTH domain